MRPSLALSVARIVYQVLALPRPVPTPMRESKSRQRAGRLGRIRVRERRIALDPQEAERQASVQTMTNWQRTQWARAGYPKSLSKINNFCALQRGSRR